MSLPEQLVAAILFFTAGGCAFLVLLNRVLLSFRDHPLKSVIIVLIAGAMTIGAGGFGFLTGFSAWLICPLIGLAGVIIGEIRRSILRFQAKGLPPDETINARLDLTHPFTNTDLVITRYTIPFPHWQGSPLRIVHLSDLHLSAHYPWHYYEKILRHVTDATPDVLFITGDFVTKAKDILLLPQFLTPLNQLCRTFAVLGNHDYWADADEIAHVVRNAGIDLLRHECREVELENGQKFYLSGDEAPWGQGNAPRRNAHISTNCSDMLRIVLTHTPDNIYRLSAAGAHAVFAGHYHAGQFRLPYLGSLVVPSAYGRRFDHGHFIVNGTHLFVTSGIGAAVAPIRIYCQPDFFIVDVTAGS